MKAFGKILGLVLLGLLLIIVALGFALTHWFDPNDYKDEIRQMARDKAHIELTLKGDIGWSLFPWLGLELHDASVATLSNPTKPFADLQMLGLSVRVLPLLPLPVTTAAGAPEQAAGTPPDSRPAEAEKPSQPLRLDIDSLTVNNARVEFNDEKSGRQITSESIQLSTGPVHEGKEIAVKLTAFFGTNQPVLRARTELGGNLRFDRALKRYQFEDMRLTGEASGDPLQGKSLTFSVQGQLLVDMAANIAEWTSLKLSANQLRAIGELKARDLDKTAQFSGGLSIAQFDLMKFLDSIGQPLPTRLSGTPTSLALNNINLKLDDSSFSGRIAVEDFAKQALRVQLKGDKFDADRYLPPKSAEAESASKVRQAEVLSSEADAWSNDRLLPIERLRSLDVDAELDFDQLILKKLPIDNAALKANGQGGLLTLTSLRGNLYNGSFDSKGSLDVRNEQPRLNLQTRLNRVPVERVLQAQGQKSPVTGAITLDSNLSGTGNSEKTLIDSLNGTASFVLNNGVLLNANLEQQLCTGIALLNRKTLSSEPRGKDTPFQELKGSLSIRNGVASNPDLKVRIPGLAVNGNGDIDLRVLGMDYRVGITVEGDKSDMPDPACQVGEHFADIEWPLRCRGPLELGAKACRIDKDGGGRQQAEREDRREAG